MSLVDFENEYWTKYSQKPVFRHRASLDLIEKGPVLDLGCGDGLFLEMLKNKNIKGIGIDISKVALERARLKGLDVREFNFVDNKLPFEDRSFETVTLLEVLEHLYQPENTLREAHRLTKRNLVLCVPNFNSLPLRIQMLRGQRPKCNRSRQGHVYWFNWEILENLLKNNNFEIEIIKVNSFFTWAPGLKNIMQFLARIRPSIFALNFVIKARKI